MQLVRRRQSDEDIRALRCGIKPQCYRFAREATAVVVLEHRLVVEGANVDDRCRSLVITERDQQVGHHANFSFVVQLHDRLGL